jgi:hypothetical protein
LSSDAWLALYEIERRAWDQSGSFANIGTASDPNNLYQHLRANDVEFYITDQEYFSVQAFDGWNLTQGLFDGVQLPQAVFNIDDWLDDEENYP